MYSFPKTSLSLLCFFAISGPAPSLASFANAIDAATFISSFMSVAATSRAPLNINGKPSTLLTWLG